MTPRGKQRLKIIALAALAVTLLLIGLYFVRQHQHRQALEDQRQRGIELVQSGYYRDGFQTLNDYASRASPDADTLYHMAWARAHWPPPRQAARGHAVGILERALVLEPDHEPAARRLMRLLIEQDEPVQALELAQQRLDNDPDDLLGLKVKAQALSRMQRWSEAAEHAERVLAIDLTQWPMHLLLAQSDHAQRLPVDQRLARTRRKLEMMPGDPRAELAHAMALALAGHPEPARAWVQRAAERSPVDARFSSTIMRMMDELALYTPAVELLARDVELLNHPELTRELIERLYDRQAYQRIVDHFDEHPRFGDAQLIALDALARLRTGDASTLQEAQHRLENRDDEPIAQAWAAALQAQTHDPDVELAQRLDLLRQALAQWSEDPVLRAELARAFARAGEIEHATAIWQSTHLLRPHWAQPWVARAQPLADHGDPERAVRHLNSALLRDPQSTAAWDALLSVATAHHQQQGQLPLTVQQMLDALQGHGPPAMQALRLYRDAEQHSPGQMREAIDELLDNTSPGPAVYEALLELNQSLELQHADRIFEAWQDAKGITPELIARRARWLAQQGEPDAGLTLWDEHVDSQPALDWQRARARYLSTIEHAQAADAWRELADAYPDALGLQHEALQQAMVWDDDAFIERAIDRLRSGVGDVGLHWRLARAQHLLNSDTAPATRQAGALINQVLERAPEQGSAHRLMARIHRRLDQPTLAAQHLQQAIRLKGSPPELRLQLARLHIDLGHTRRALRELDAVMQDPSTTAEHRDQAARLHNELTRDDPPIHPIGR